MALDATTLGNALSCSSSAWCTGMRGPDPVEGFVGRPQTPVEARVADLVEGGARVGAADLDGDRARRSGLVCQVVVPRHPAPRLASAVARQCRRHVPARRLASPLPADPLGSHRGAPVARARHGVWRPPNPSGLYPAGLWGRRPSSAVVAPHRFATAGRRCLLVRLESLDRARFQKDQGAGGNGTTPG